MTEAERRVYEASPIPLAFYAYRDEKVVTELVSDGYCRMVGIPRAALVSLLDNSMFERVHPDDAGRLASIGARFARRECGYDVLYRTRLGDDPEYRYVHTVGHWHTMEDGTDSAILVYRDLTASLREIEGLRLDYEQLQRDRYYIDAVTGLPSLNYVRQFADEKINKLWACGAIPALVYVDIRAMSAYNNLHGYAEGDALLKLTGEALAGAFPNALVGRGTNDHFIVFDRYDVELGQKVLSVNDQVKAMAAGRISGLQCAIVQLKPDMKAVEALDRARSTIKDIGDDMNVVYRHYSQREDDAYWMSRYILQNFDEALNNGWIKVYYQPILRSCTEKMTILEGLARWIDPVQGVISPGTFIPVLSRYHLLHRLDLYMVEQICREFHARKDAGLPLIPVSVNFSAQDFDYVDVVQALNGTVAKYGLERRSIVVEITEQDLAQASDHFRTQLRRIHDSGYLLWIDDFGSGYSSLNVFSQFHVDRVKFDLELLRHLDDNDGANRIIMKSIVDMCRRIGVHTLAEGVETEAQYKFLRDIDCEMVQGYHFFKPEPLEMSVFKFSQTGPIIATETAEERRELCDRWIARGRKRGE